jgi:hypothetical protein
VNAHSSTHIRWILTSWLGLVGLTVISWWLGFEHGSDSMWIIATLMVLAFAKVFLVGHSFMEVRTAPRILRQIYTWWCIAACMAVVAAAALFG